jgi:hypothetical protein
MKRILSLDGGGIRGVFTLQVLARLEELFRQQTGNPQLVLGDAFDLIAGTSTGAIIATCLKWGMPVAEIQRLYAERGAAMFAPSPWHQRWRSKYRADALAEMFRSLFTDAGQPARLGSNGLGKLLLVVMRNASTGSPWPLTNNPAALFNDPACGECNLDIPLWQLLRASTAAPTFFPPEQIIIGPQQHLFVDGGITPYNNPALLAVLVATLPGYRVHWPAGRDALHVISVGTGRQRIRLPKKLAAQMHLLDHIQYAAPALVSSIAVEQDLLCRAIGDCLHGEPIDMEIGDLLAPTLLPPEHQRFTYVRYDMPLTDAGAAAMPLDDLRAMPLLIDLGRRYAAEHVQAKHLFPRSDALAQ